MMLTTAKHAFTTAQGGGLLFEGGVTFVEAPRPARRYSIAFRCEDGGRGEEDLADGPLEFVPEGATLGLFGMVGAYPAQTEAPGRCEVVLASKGADGKGQTHGTYCLEKGNGKPGSCAPPFTVRERVEEQVDDRYEMRR